MDQIFGETGPKADVESPEQKLGRIRAVIDNRFPNPDFATMVSEELQVPLGQFTDEERGMVALAERRWDFLKEWLSTDIGEANISEKDLEIYVDEMIAFEEKIHVGSNSIDSMRRTFSSIVKASESLEKLRVWEGFFEDWSREMMQGIADPDLIKERLQTFDGLVTDISERNVYPPPVKSLAEIKAQYPFFLEVYKYIDTLPFGPQQTQEQKEALQSLKQATKRVATKNHDPEPARRILKLFDECRSEDPVRLKRLIDIASSYGAHHGFSEEAFLGFKENILPALKRNDPQVEVLQKAGNTWGMKQGDFGLADFVCHSYSVEVRPDTINQLLMALREIPTTSASRLEQNRKDALLLANPFGILRDFIHDQRPLVREVVTAMVRYYDTHDEGELRGLLPKTDYFNSPGRIDAILDLAKYDEDFTERDTGRTIRGIEILKRLSGNTQMVEEQPPQTSEAVLSRSLQELKDSKSFEKKEKLGKAMDLMNSRLESMMQEKTVGIEPDLVLAIAWLERRGFEVLQNLTYEEQWGSYKMPWFQSILKFQELTASVKYDPRGFEGFIEQLNQAGAPKEAYKAIGTRTLEHVSNLGKLYRDSTKPYIQGALWSGNVTHELIGLIDWKPAETVAGERHRKEQAVPEIYRVTGD